MQQLKSHKTFDGLTQFWEHDSSETKTKMKFSTFVPKGGKPKGALIWLSGLTCTDENFITKAGAQKFLSELNMMVVCPDTSPRGTNLPGEHDAYDFGSGAGFYVDATTPGYKDHYRMYSYVSKELYGLIQQKFGVSSFSISGHSMGGHGALVIGLREPQKFKSVSAFSPIVNPINCPWGQKALPGYLGNDEMAWKSYDATELVKAGKIRKDTLLIDQGLADEFLEKQLLTNHLKEAAQSRGQAVEVNFRDGYDHSYYFISTFIESHLKFHSRALD